MPHDEKIFLKIKQDKNKIKWKNGQLQRVSKMKNKNMQKQEINGRKRGKYKKGKKQK